MQKTKLEYYNIEALISLGNQTNDDMMKNDIKSILVDKYMTFNYPILFLLNGFVTSNGILMEVYAELILMTICESNFVLSPKIIDVVISLVSIDTLTKYGMESKNLELAEKCKNEFLKRALDSEDNVNLIKKKFK